MTIQRKVVLPWGMQLHQLKRREFVTLLGSTAIAWPLAAYAQPDRWMRMRRVGVLMNTAADKTDAQVRLAAFLQGLQIAGWEVGRDVHVRTRWSRGDTTRLHAAAMELMALPLDAAVAGVGATTKALQQASASVPIVFAEGIDPVGAGYVESLVRPGGNTTGFTALDYGLAGRWLELLKQLAPLVTHAAVLREPGTPGIGQWAVIQAAAQALGIGLRPITLTDADEIERAVSAFAREPDGGLVVTASAASLVHRDLIVGLAARHRLPAAYAYRSFPGRGGLISYGPDIAGLYRRAAAYVDRILRGERPGDLPVVPPARYELVINLKTARELGLDVPPALLKRADEAID